MQVLAGVVEVHDLGGLGELGGGDVPDPGGAVADDGELADVVRAAADALGLHEVRERGGGLEGGDVAGGVPVPDRVPVLVQLVLGEEDGQLDLAGAGAAVLALPVPPGGLLRGHRDAGAVDDGVELVRQRGRRQRHQLAGGDQRGRASREAAAGAAPLASAARSTRLTVSRTPARSSSSPAARANGTAAAARSFIAARPGDIDLPGHAELGVAGREAVPAARRSGTRPAAGRPGRARCR